MLLSLLSKLQAFEKQFIIDEADAESFLFSRTLLQVMQTASLARNQSCYQSTNNQCVKLINSQSDLRKNSFSIDYF